MNTELRELDAWIAENVMGHEMAYGEMITVVPNPADGEPMIVDHAPPPQYTTDLTAAMQVLKKCAERIGAFEHISINLCEDEFSIRMAHANWDWIHAETLELAICRFARKLFEK